MYVYLTPADVYNRRKELIDRPVALAYWTRWDDTRRQSADWYAFRFRTLCGVVPGPHAYTLVLSDRNETLISYDTVCVYYVDLNKYS